MTKESKNPIEQYIAVVKYGDPNTHRQLQTSWGIFDSHEDAKAWVHGTYHGKNHIVDIISFNILEKKVAHKIDIVE